MARIITLRFPATCADCGSTLPAGAKARYYGRGKTYGIGCHPDQRGPGERGKRREARLSTGRRVVSTRCEDYPCCGHGPVSSGGDGGGCPVVYESGAKAWRCAGCRAELPEGHPSALCDGCLGRAMYDDDHGDFADASS